MRAILLLSLLLMSFTSSATDLEIVDGEKVYSYQLANLYTEARDTARLYAPFRKQNVEFRGFDFERFLRDRVGRDVQSVRITAADGYEVNMAQLRGGTWMLVTHENGEPLTLKNLGPLRLIQTDIGDRDPENMSLFDDWIWMVKKIEVVN